MDRVQGTHTQEKRETDGNGHKKQRGSAGKIAVGFGILALLGTAVAAYVYQSGQYKDTFFPNTVINGIDASGKTVEEVKTLIGIGMSGYRLVVEGRGGVREEIPGFGIDLHPEYDGSLEQLLAMQNPLLWGLHYMEGSRHSVETITAFDQEKLQQVISSFACMDEAGQTPPVDARLSDYIPGTGYQVIPEEKGTQVIPEVAVRGISDAIQNLQDRVSLEELGAYTTAEITARDPGLAALAEAWNRHTGVQVTYQFGDVREVLDGETIHTWLTADDQGFPLLDDQGKPVLDEEKVAEYVSGLAKTYNTAYKPKTLQTTYGPTVTITGGNYGWRINQKAETAELLEIVRSGESQEREPVYLQTAASHGEHDYGDTYVEINLTAQHLYFYKDGALVVDSDFVSGNVARGHTTPPGAFPVTYKQRNAVLKGQGYASPVSYWMPFNGGIGMHDASWRGRFGGKIYRTNGSHGCVNLPVSAARAIYEEISAGMPVLCYNLEGTSGAAPVAVAEGTPGGSASASAGSGQSAAPASRPSSTAPAVPAAAPAVPAAPAAPAAPAGTSAAQETSPVPESQGTTETIPDPAQSQEGEASVIMAETGEWQGGPGIQTAPEPRQQETAPEPAPMPVSPPEAPAPAPVPETVPDPYSVPAPAPQETPAAAPGSSSGPGGPSSRSNGAVSAPGM